jgi:hypothetical protein
MRRRHAAKQNAWSELAVQSLHVRDKHIASVGLVPKSGRGVDADPSHLDRVHAGEP